MKRPDVGSLWLNNLMPLALGLVIGYAQWLKGVGWWAIPASAAMMWILWQLGRWVERWRENR